MTMPEESPVQLSERNLIDAADSCTTAARMGHALNEQIERAVRDLSSNGEQGARVDALANIARQVHNGVIQLVQLARVTDPRSTGEQALYGAEILREFGVDVGAVHFAEGPYAYWPKGRLNGPAYYETWAVDTDDEDEGGTTHEG